MNNEMTLEKIKKAIANNTIEYLNDAFSDSYGTDGELRYYQDVKVDGIEMRISFKTTQDYDEWSELYKEWTDLRNNEQRTDDEELRYQELKSNDVANSHFLDDESCNCNWENPVDFEITE